MPYYYLGGGEGYAVDAKAQTFDSHNQGYGISGTSWGVGKINIGVYGTAYTSASGATTPSGNWAGYFDGNVYSSGTVIANGGTFSTPVAATTTFSYTASTATWVINGVPTTRKINTSSPLTGSGDLSSDLTLGIRHASDSVDGYLSSTDWTTFNNKLSPTGSGTGLTGVVKISGSNMTGQLTTSSSITVQGSAFSVGGSTFAVVS